MENHIQFVDLVTAKNMKQLGFKEKCLAFFAFSDKKCHLNICDNLWHEHKNNTTTCHAASWEHAEYWLLKEGIWIQIEYTPYEERQFGYSFHMNGECVLMTETSNTNIDARKAGIADAIQRMVNIKSFNQFRWACS